ncbi:hypothetical protein V8G54_024671 [Vigna mungo]|uniref:Gnk2-homologous domain-containing protein n=1 Tax=Vigna mungo TaxID=3915 RepID=A0AAQ3N7I0_VIGMU
MIEDRTYKMEGNIYVDIRWKRPHVTKAQTPSFLASNCQNTTQQPLSSVYQTNLDRMLRWASSDAATSKGYNYKSIAPQRCPNNRVSAMVWYEFCILRYSNESFYGTVLTNISWHVLGEKNISNMEDIHKGDDFVRGLIKKATKETNQLFYMDVLNLSSTEKRYGLVQCSRDLTKEGCRQCLETILAQVAKCREQKLGWVIWTGSCAIKYDDHMFYQTSSVAEPNPKLVYMGGGVELEKAWRIWCEGNCLEMMDPTLEKSFIGSEVERCIQIGLLCVQEDAKDRSSMSDVVVMLASEGMVLPKPKHPPFLIGRMTLEEFSTSNSSKNLSINDVTTSVTIPR